MSRPEDGSGGPRAMIHRRILDVAESDPDASLAAIAEEVTGASADLVERVLERYGDPAEEGDQPDGSSKDPEPTGETMSETKQTEAPSVDANGTEERAEDPNDDADGAGKEVTAPDPSELSDKQVDALRRIAADPDATQRELAEELDVTAATVSRWLNDIPGFAWDRRRTFVSRTLNGNDTTGRGSEDGASAGHGDDPVADAASEATASVADLRRRIEALEEERGDSKSRDCAVRAPLDPDLLHKVIHACMASDRITEDEELRVLDGLIGKEG